MTLEFVLFHIMSAISLISALFVIVAKNPVRAVLYLVLTFVSTAVIWLLLEAEFLAISLILVYVGAVMVLFIFVVMMLDIEMATIQSSFARYLPVAACVASLVVLGLVVATEPLDASYAPITPRPDDYSNVKELGQAIYTHYLLQFEVAGMMLLVAIISAICLSFRGQQHRKVQSPHEQIRVKPDDRLRIVKMPVSIEDNQEKDGDDA